MDQSREKSGHVPIYKMNLDINFYVFSLIFSYTFKETVIPYTLHIANPIEIENIKLIKKAQTHT